MRKALGYFHYQGHTKHRGLVPGIDGMYDILAFPCQWHPRVKQTSPVLGA